MPCQVRDNHSSQDIFNGKYGLHQRCYTIKDYCANIHGKYLYYYLSTQNNYFIAFAVGSTVPSLRLDTFQQAKVFIPSLPEQQKISNFLSSIDEKISHCSAQIEKNLDSKTAYMIIELMKKIQKEHHTTFVVFATHDEKIVANVDRLITIVDGEIVEEKRMMR